MQQEPREASRLETVPEPMIEPAPSTRVLAACATSWAKEKVMSSPALGAPNSVPFRCTDSGRCTLPSDHASPSSSGVTATREQALAGFDWKNAKPFARSAGPRL